MKKKNILIFIGYAIFIAVSMALNFDPGKQIGNNFLYYFGFMCRILPPVFILIGLFEVWVKRETIEKHLGKESGIKGYMWAILLGGTSVGGLYIAFPVAETIYRKGAGLNVIFTYVGAAAICRIPMTIFEAGFMGIKFSLLRLAVSIPLVIISSIILADYLNKHNYKLKNSTDDRQPATGN